MVVNGNSLGNGVSGESEYIMQQARKRLFIDTRALTFEEKRLTANLKAEFVLFHVWWNIL